MFNFAILIGIYTYIIFFLGISNLLYKEVVNTITILFIFSVMLFFRKSILNISDTIRRAGSRLRSDRLSIVTIALLILLAGVNLMGALGPELAFDALWYHLTIPKLYLLNHAIYHIPGGLLYYSDMPKLGELLYVGAMAFGNEIVAKVIHWMFGIFILICIYRLSRKFFNQSISLIAALIFYSNLVVAWESTTAYIDLIRTFFEVLALSAFVYWWRLGRKKWFVLSALMTGLAVATKLLALGTIVIFVLLILYKYIVKERSTKNAIQYGFGYVFISLSIAAPWFIFSFLNTGNPIYPIFSDIFAGLHTKIFDSALINPVIFSTTLWNVFTHASDPLSPVYIIFFPLLIYFFLKSKKDIKILYGYSILALCYWYTTSQIEGSRLLVPYLPALSIICAGVIDQCKEKGNVATKNYLLLILIVLFIGLTTTAYRFIANSRYIAVVIGTQTKDDFLSNTLNFSFGDFYDTDGYFAQNIKPEDMVLLYGFHNLYYIDFPYIHHSWAKAGDNFNYVATQDAELPSRFKSWRLIYENNKTNVKLYSDGGKQWEY